MKTAYIDRLEPVLPGATPLWPESVWVGEISDEAVTATALTLAGAAGFGRARLLVRHGRAPRGFVELGIEAGRLDGVELRRLITALPAAADAPPDDSLSISVVLCTRNRPEHLRTALASLQRLEYANFEVVVVDNGSDTDATHRIVADLDDARVRSVDAPVAGLSRARNVGLRHARHDLVAFTDDDVVVDPGWLAGIAAGFRSEPDVSCVSGMVPSVELTSPCQAYFDKRVTWARNCVRESFSLRRPRPAEPMFPFEVGRFGTGANFAIRRQTVIALGGFDEGFGVGSPTGGGEDIDMFVRVLLNGHTLVYEPSAIIWHRHRPDLASLTKQIRDYGTGLGAWITQLALQPRTAMMITRRSVPALAHLGKITRIERDHDPEIGDLGRAERLAVLRGPLALLKARLHGARRRPLAQAARHAS
ncbi:glycosyltransferase [Actinoplanes sp. NPDC051346]|uniref:glycosyltransferase family 2 protein n=1 Tax=Actinoplanes sp. NPDC051346 TaxID=3155048 RepID=UPI00342E15D5